mmetsp:Transcript_19698/g.32297  ORF Transcript_19698/g.32297 Transcript_19698/m.32297 type:complete len:298 (-) Transcript_19698:890-1783(-)
MAFICTAASHRLGENGISIAVQGCTFDKRSIASLGSLRTNKLVVNGRPPTHSFRGPVSTAFATIAPLEHLTDTIPIVDFKSFTDERVSREKMIQTVQSIMTANESIGFMYLTNHGIPADKIERLFTYSKQLFGLKQEVKALYSYDHATNSGYIGYGRELMDPRRAPDLKEAFNFRRKGKPWPSEMPPLDPIVEEMVNESFSLTKRLLRAFAIGLQMPETHFTDRHSDESCSTFRMLHYLPIPLSNLMPKQRGITEHTDPGTITILFQDEAGGLEVFTKGKKMDRCKPSGGGLGREYW